MDVGTVLILILVIVLACVVWIYNSLVKARNFVKDAWAGIEVQLTKRHDLIPLLVTTVRAYVKHESSLFDDVVKLRSPELMGSTEEIEHEEQSFGDQFSQLMLLAEDYPDIKADQNFRKLQDQLVAVESDIESARRYYNGSVRDMNVSIESFPSNLIAHRFGFRSGHFFELRLASMREAPKVAL